ncbi:putative F-box/LRR-repeat protein At3g44080 [Triticum aestivum]|uniref:putative F-box/LRR-repeat protein At3g44080 n=1 Tax=Triticum aestivum TaxID=4565 RepID=UPI001D003655|nr:putative F-box/LRR-repeat protein At3g44080 [Triticum aestivum]
MKKLSNDRISALPDDVLLTTLQFVDLRTAVSTGALARRWRHLPRLLSSLAIDVATLVPHPKGFSPPHHTVDCIMKSYTDSARWFLAEERSIKSLCLAFYLIDPYLLTIGDAVLKSLCRASRVHHPDGAACCHGQLRAACSTRSTLHVIPWCLSCGFQLGNQPHPAESAIHCLRLPGPPPHLQPTPAPFLGPLWLSHRLDPIGRRSRLFTSCSGNSCLLLPHSRPDQGSKT